MARAIAQVSLRRHGGLPEDDSVNVFHFESDDAYSTGAAGLISRLSTFYSAIGLNLHTALDGTGIIKLYNFDDPKPRVPTHEESFSFTPGQSGYPSEIALCLSMRAETVSGGNAARRRGRVFLGPLNSSVGAYTTATDPDYRPADLVREAILDAAETMAVGGSGAFRLAVYSPTTDLAGTADEAWNDVVEIWIDNAFDVIRKRGVKPTSRLSRAI